MAIERENWYRVVFRFGGKNASLITASVDFSADSRVAVRFAVDLAISDVYIAASQWTPKRIQLNFTMEMTLQPVSAVRRLRELVPSCRFVYLLLASKVFMGKWLFPTIADHES